MNSLHELFGTAKKQSAKTLSKVDEVYSARVVTKLLSTVSKESFVIFDMDDVTHKNYFFSRLEGVCARSFNNVYRLSLAGVINSIPRLPQECRMLLINVDETTLVINKTLLQDYLYEAIDREIPVMVACVGLFNPGVDCFIRRIKAPSTLFSTEDVKYLSDMYDLDPSEDVYAHTGGIPHLTQAYINDCLAEKKLEFDCAYIDELKKCYNWYLRKDLGANLRRFRLFTLLNGYVDSTLFSSYEYFKPVSAMCLTSPLLKEEYSKLVLVGAKELIACSSVLKYHEQFVKAESRHISDWLEDIRAKKKWDDLGRILSALPYDEVYISFIAECPFELINAGYSNLIHKANENIHVLTKLDALNIKIAECFLKSDLNNVSRLMAEVEKLDNEKYLVAQKWMNILRVLKGKFSELETDMLSKTDTIDDEISLHVDTWKSILSGNLEHAYSKLLMGCRNDYSALTSSLLIIDQALVSMLMGDFNILTVGDCFLKAIETINNSNIAGLIKYVTVFKDCVDCVVLGNQNHFTLDRGIQVSAKNRDAVVCASLSLFGAVQNIKSKNIVGVYTQLNALKTVFNLDEMPLLENIRQVLLTYASSKLGDYKVLSDNITIENNCDYMLKCLSAAIKIQEAEDQNDKECVTQIERTIAKYENLDPRIIQEVPYGVFALTTALVSNDVRLGERLHRYLPQLWSDELDKYMILINESKLACKNVLEERSLHSKKTYHKEKLYINMLGDFSVKTRGEVIPEKYWTRVSSLNLLLYLAIAENHRLSRADIVELLWPDKDYISGRTCLYTAVCFLKKIIKHDDELRPYIITKQGFIGLNPEYVDIDFDNVITIAKEITLKGLNLGEIVRKAEDLQQLYSGSLFVPVAEESGLFENKKNVVNNLYSDAMLKTAEALYRIRDYKRAIWYAKQSQLANASREDVVKLLLEAYGKLGRKTEAIAIYKSYTKDLLGLYGLAPSKSLTRLFKSLKNNNIKEDDDEEGGSRKAI